MPAWRLILALTMGAASTADAFVEQIQANFAVWDAGGSGELSTGEIDAVVADPQVRGPGAGAMAVVKRASRYSRWFPNAGF